jgi:HAE1 family hydrophobic/amphiphilic exporter-1
MAGLGFSVNMTTLFGLVLAIGIVVDDAIVVVENTSRHIEGGMAARPAAVRAMQEVTGPVIATTLVLLAVFVPTAFLPGITGQLYRQFGLTISAATVFSSINALTLSPALCALLLKPRSAKRNVFFRWFNTVFEWGEGIYGRVVAVMVRRAAIGLVLFVGVTFLAGWGFVSLPTAFLPEEDQGYLVAGIQLPDAASQERTREAVQKIDAVLERTPGVSAWVTLGSFSVLDSTVSANAAAFYIILDPFEERPDSSLSQDAIIARLRGEFAEIQEGIAFVFVPPAIFGLGAAGGFQLELQDRGGLGLAALQRTAMEMARDGNAQAGLVGLNTTFRATVPQLFVDVDRTQAKTSGVPLENVFSTMQAYLGSKYVNDFNRFGRTYQVKVQADHEFRIQPDDIKRLYTRNTAGRMVPLGAIVSVREELGPQMVRRYNLYPSAAINGQAAPGFSSGDALGLMEQMAEEKLPQAMGFQWTGMSFQEKQVGSEAILIFALAILLVFLVLAAQYESWTAPISIVLAVPFALLGVVIALKMRAFSNDVYTQIGIVLLIGLASKTAILIVEFAREMRAGGKGIGEAAVEASRLRFRPVLMTAISFVFGTLPLLAATGAGAASRRAVGTAVFGGMLVATLLTVILVPVFFAVFQGLGERLSRPVKAASAEAERQAG